VDFLKPTPLEGELVILLFEYSSPLNFVG